MARIKNLKRVMHIQGHPEMFNLLLTDKLGDLSRP